MLARLTTLALALGVSFATAGCGPSCTKSSSCAVLGTPPNVQVCDGNDYKACTDSNRGQQVPCQHTPEIAECTLTGWTFVSASSQ